MHKIKHYMKLVENPSPEPLDQQTFLRDLRTIATEVHSKDRIRRREAAEQLLDLMGQAKLLVESISDVTDRDAFVRQVQDISGMMVGVEGIEPSTTAMSRQCSTSELRARRG